VRSQARSVLKVTAGLCGLAVVLGTILILLRIGTTHAPLADGMASAEVITWLDEDQDGVRDEGEPPFPWVEISPGWRAITNDAGRGSTYEFMAGCARDCWVTSYASVHTPQGYAPTTPTTYRLTAESETYEFGFIRASTGYVPDLPNSPPWVPRISEPRPLPGAVPHRSLPGNIVPRPRYDFFPGGGRGRSL